MLARQMAEECVPAIDNVSNRQNWDGLERRAAVACWNKGHAILKAKSVSI